MEKKPNAFIRRFIEWSHSHGCPILYKYDTETEWKPLLTNHFNWKACNYKIENISYQNHYERLYSHGMN